MPTYANQCVPLFRPGQDITVSCDVPLAGKTFVSIKANQAAQSVTGLAEVVQCAAAAKPFGVLAYDGAADEVVDCIRSGVVPMIAGGALQSGQGVEVGANGQPVVAASGVRIGTVMFNAGAGAEVFIALELGA
jgi:hypothetical protein